MATTDDAAGRRRFRQRGRLKQWCYCVRLHVCVCCRTTLLIERLLHYYNRQEPPMKGSYVVQTIWNKCQPVDCRLVGVDPLHYVLSASLGIATWKSAVGSCAFVHVAYKTAAWTKLLLSLLLLLLLSEQRENEKSLLLLKHYINKWIWLR